jgi:integrase
VTVRHLLKDEATGRLSYRRIYPKELRPYIPGNPKHLKRSLKATRIEDTAALAIYNAAHAEYETAVASARKKLEGRFDALNPPMIAYLAQTFKVEWLAADDAKRTTGDQRGLDLQENAIKEFLPEFRKWKARGQLDEIVDRWQSDAQRLVDREGLWLDPSDPDRLDGLCTALNGAAIEASLECLARLKDAGALITPAAPQRPSEAPLEAPAAPKGITLEAIATAYMTDERLPVSTSSKESIRTAIRFFGETHGPIAADVINVAKVSEWLDLMAKRPAKLTQADKQLDLKALRDRYASQTDVQRMSPKTQEKYVNALSQCWKHAQSTGSIDREKPNPFRGHRFAKVARSKAIKGYRIDELQAIFDLPLFHGERVKGKYSEASYWLPLILVLTGARPEEAAQLMVPDFFPCPDTGVWLIEFTDEGEHPVKGPRNLKTSHHDSGHRKFPVPETLLRLGLLSYLSALKAAGYQALFPTLDTKSERGLLFTNYGKWWVRHVTEAGILEQGRKASRDMRHNWATAAHESGLPREAMEYIMGHKDSSTSAHAVYGNRQALGQRIHDVKFKGLDLSRVLPWEPSKAF